MSRTKSNGTGPDPRQRRNYKAEYDRRIARALAEGKSRSAGRGHPTAADLQIPVGPIDRQSPLEKALTRIKRGETQKSAAKAEGVSVEKLRVYQKSNTTALRQGRRWIISDNRPVAMVLATRGHIQTITVPADEANEIGRYWSHVNKFLDTNTLDHLEPFVGKGVRDTQGRVHPFEVRPNVLRKLDGVGELDFLEIYADVAK
jgi:hypothetical protein